MINFNTILDRLTAELHCNAKDLAKISGLSETGLSRYRSGERTPPRDAYERLEKGAVQLAEQKNITLSPDTLQALQKLSAVRQSEFSAVRFETLLKTLHISLKELSSYVKFAPLLSVQNQDRTESSFSSGTVP